MSFVAVIGSGGANWSGNDFVCLHTHSTIGHRVGFHAAQACYVGASLTCTAP